MKRWIKNVLMISIIVLLSVGLAYTGVYAKDHMHASNRTMMNGNKPGDNGFGNGETPPSMPGNSSSDTSSNSVQDKPGSSNKDMITSDENSNNSSSQEDSSKNMPPEKPNNDNGNPPAKPDSSNVGDDDNQDSNGMKDNSGNTNMPGNGNTPPSMLNDMNNSSTGSKLTWSYYVIFISGSVVIAGLGVYLVMSGFNKKSFKETFSNKDKIIIDILGVIIVTEVLSVGSLVLTNKIINSNSGSNGPGMQMNGGSQASYSAVKEITTDEKVTSGTYSSENSDENAISVSGKITSSLDGVTVTKNGDSDGGDSTSFYGTNSGIIAKERATLSIDNATIETNATGANGIFSYGGSATTSNSSSDGTTVNISNSKITTTKDNSGGIMTTGGGVMNATNLEINTAGTSSAAIRSDRGGGTVNVDGGTYITTGQGSPTIYSTANIAVKNAYLKATSSEGVVIEGKNSVTLENVTLEDTNNKLNGQSTTYKNLFLYQSMSGDADTGMATFKASNSKITTNKGDTLYVTNAKATITLENNTIVNKDKTGNFLRIQKDSWGNSGSNGGEVTLYLKNQKVTGNIVVDTISTLSMSLTSNSSYTGIINGDKTAQEINLTLDKSSKIKLTGDSYVTSLDNEDSSNSNIDFNGYKLYVDGVAIN